MKLKLILLSLLLLCSCQKQSNDEFRQVWSRLETSDNWIFGSERLEAAQAELKNPDLTPVEQAEVWSRLARYHLRLAHDEKALEAIEKAVELSKDSPLHPEFVAYRGLVWLRMAEVRNCILRGGQSSCIFPLDEEAVHFDKRPAQKAFDDLLFYLRARKDNPTDPGFYHSRLWLLNISAMQLGFYPDKVPEEFRLQLQVEPPKTEEVFEDIAAGVGIIDKNLAGGAAVEDFNGDGFLDIASSSLDFREPTRLYLNSGDGTFKEFTNEAGLSDQTGAFNVRAADYDGDGDQDLLLLRGAFLRDHGAVRNSLLQNDGKGRFRDVTKAAGLDDGAHPTGTACWGDFNGDGKLDLFIGNETAPNKDGTHTPHPCQLYFNNGDGTFTEKAAESGVEGLIYVKGVATADIDNDGDLDLFASNFGSANLPTEVRGRNLLFRNKGDGTFEEVGEQMGIGGPDYRGFATWFFDYDNDGWQDLFVACYETDIGNEVSQYLGLDSIYGRTCLYRNNQGQSFTNVTYEVGLGGVMSIMGASFGDPDNDGFQDLYLGTGSAYYEHLVPNLMLKNQGAAKFEDITFSRGLGHLQKGHGIVFADFDHDGDQDIYAQMGGNFVGDAFSNSLFENPGNDNNSLTLQLSSEYQLVGARVEVVLADRSIHRAVGMVSSFGHTPLRQTIGLGKADEVEKIVVKWPSGETTEYEGCKAGFATIREENTALDWRPLKPFKLRKPQPGDPFCRD